jgi:2-methylaconitate isomerase
VRPATGDVAIVRMRNTNLNARIDGHIPVAGGEVIEDGDFELDGVAFAAAEIRLEFFDPCGSATKMFPTGNAVDILNVPAVGRLHATMIHAGGSAVLVLAEELGLRGTELQSDVNGDAGRGLRLAASCAGEGDAD